MRIHQFGFLLVLFTLLPAFAQTPPASAAPAGPGPHRIMMGAGDGKMTIMVRPEMGKWWEVSEIAKKLQLGDNQITQLDQIFYDHRLKLIDYQADMEKEDLKLQNLLDADVPNEGQISSQVDQVLGARGKLEREFTMMNLDLRKVLSVEQWRQLKSIHRQHHGGTTNFMYHKTLPGGGPGVLPDVPLPPLPPPGAEEMF